MQVKQKNTMPDKIFVGYFGVGKYWGEWTSETHKDNQQYVRKDLFDSLENKSNILLKALEDICKGSAYDLDWRSDGKDYDIAIKAIQSWKSNK